MKHISIQDAKPGMILARSIYNQQGKVLLAHNITLNMDFIKKLESMAVTSIFIKHPDFDDIDIPEYIRPETQQKALAVLSSTMDQLKKTGTFSTDAVYSVASTIVEEILQMKDLVVHLTGIITYDDYTFAHSLNCGIYSAIIATLSGLPVPKIKEIACGAILHDVGKIAIDHAIVTKPGKLTDEEMEVMRTHAEEGFAILIKKRWEISSLVSHMAWQHHERIDGTGYPRGLKGEEILNYARILSIADVYEAMTSDRPYRKGLDPQQAFEIIEQGLGSQFDAEYGLRFLSKIAIYTPGTEIVLSSGELAVVISVPALAPKRPIIRIISDEQGRPCSPCRDINLSDYPDLQIIDKVPPIL